MFKKILVALDHSKSDSVLLPRVKELCRLTNASLLLLHVSTGWKASWQRDLNLTDSLEMEEDRDYLREVERSLRQEGFEVDSRHATGNAADAIVRTAREENCDLIAMATHGHRWLSDLIHGTTIGKVRHETDIPLFLVKGSPT
ncbi:MAG TPA: universal stress protein [Terriglobia bacterium]|jgi:manganese transport protein|nr:universal stress protein [Terriglobia bacterium]